MALRGILGSLVRIQCKIGQTCVMQRNISPNVISLNNSVPFTATKGFQTSLACKNEHIISIQDEDDFNKRVLENSTPVVVDFFATWCGPCKLLGPRLESLVAGKNGKVILAKIDIDEMTDLAVNHGVEAVPTVIGMKNGKVIEKFVGLKDDAALQSFIDKLIS